MAECFLEHCCYCDVTHLRSSQLMALLWEPAASCSCAKVTAVAAGRDVWGAVDMVLCAFSLGDEESILLDS